MVVPTGFGLRTRLLLAFLGVASFAVLASAVAYWSLGTIGAGFGAVTRQEVPAAIASLELSRQSERMAAAGPALISARTPAELDRAAAKAEAVATGLAVLGDSLARLRPEGLDALKGDIDALGGNLAELRRLAERRTAIQQDRLRLTRQLAAELAEARRLLAPGVLRLEETVKELRARLDAPDLGVEERSELLARLDADLRQLLPQQNALVELGAFNDHVLRTVQSQDARQVSIVAHSLARSLDLLRGYAAVLPPELAAGLEAQLPVLAGYAEGDGGVVAARQAELGLVAEGEALLARNLELSAGLSEAVDALVRNARADIDVASARAEEVRAAASLTQLAVAVLSLLSSVLIVWLYVDRSLIARLTALREAMLAIAGGDLHAPAPEPASDEIGRMAAALRVFRDTAVEVEEQNLRDIAQARQRLVDAIESISEGFALFDAEGCLVLSNSRCQGMLLGADGGRIEAGVSRAEILARAAAAGRLDLAATRAALARDPEPLLRVGSAWLRYSERRVAQGGAVAILTDVTELVMRERDLEEARDRAVEATRVKSDFLATMSHELRTPLNAIVGVADLMGHTPLDEEQRDLADTMSEAAATLLAIINDILDLSKVESGGVELETIPFDLVELVDAAQELMAAKAAQKGLELIVDVDPAAPGRMVGDPLRLRQVLLNLLNNAVKFTERGEVVLRLRPAPGAPGLIEFEVEDSGIGIPPDRLDRLFRAFSQVDASTSRRYGGTGLGLVISKRLVELMGGTIAVESEVGRGTVFRFTCPVLPEGAEAPAESPAAPGPDLAGRRALVLDDSATFAAALARRLESWGMTAETVGDLAAAGARTRAGGRFDVAFVDARLPGLDLEDLPRALAPAEGTRPLILLLAPPLPDLGELRERAVAAGLAAALPKPPKARHLRRSLAAMFPAGPAASAAPATASGPARAGDRALGRLAVLLVDDNRLNQKVGGKILARLGVEPDIRGGGAEAIEACRARRYDLVFMDIEMPGMDGVEAARRLRAADLPGGTPVLVAMTANAMASDRDKYLSLGFDDYLSKPIDVEALTACLRHTAEARLTEEAANDVI